MGAKLLRIKKTRFSIPVSSLWWIRCPFGQCFEPNYNTPILNNRFTLIRHSDKRGSERRGFPLSLLCLSPSSLSFLGSHISETLRLCRVYYCYINEITTSPCLLLSYQTFTLLFLISLLFLSSPSNYRFYFFPCSFSITHDYLPLFFRSFSSFFHIFSFFIHP